MELSKAKENITLQTEISTKVLGMKIKEKERTENMNSANKVKNMKENSKEVRKKAKEYIFLPIMINTKEDSGRI